MKPIRLDIGDTFYFYGTPMTIKYIQENCRTVCRNMYRDPCRVAQAEGDCPVVCPGVLAMVFEIASPAELKALEHKPKVHFGTPGSRS